MKQLVLVRHAKSDWSDPSLADHDRPLNVRGTRNAPMMARRFAEAGHGVDVILSSTAVRAHRTAEVFSAELGLDVVLDGALYLAPAEELLRAALKTGAESVMVVAHHPGITDLARRLSDGAISHMPTCAVARFLWVWGAADRTAGALPSTELLGLQHRRPTSWQFDSPRKHA